MLAAMYSLSGLPDAFALSLPSTFVYFRLLWFAGRAFQGTDLHIILRSWGIRTLIMAGVTTNVCVESTAREGYFLDYYIVFLSDCTATTNEDRKDLTSEEIHRWTLTNIELTFGVVASSRDIVMAWQKLRAPAVAHAAAGGP